MNTHEAIGLLNYMLRDIENDAPNGKNCIEAQALTHAIEHMKRLSLPDIIPDGWRMTQKQQIVWEWAASHGLTLLADDCNDLLWKLLLIEEKTK